MTVRASVARSTVIARLRTMISVGPVLRKPPVVVLAASATASSSSSKAHVVACIL
jgi:hypothetical protein